MASKAGSEKVERNVLSGHRARILLVDEDKGDLAYYQSILQQIRCRVRACCSYDEALSALTSERFDLVVVDQGGPDFEGKTIPRKAVEIDRRLPVMVLARCFDLACYLEAMWLGAVDYLEESVKVSDLIYMLETHLGPLARSKSSIEPRISLPHLPLKDLADPSSEERGESRQASQDPS
jgi:DNA-binding NtrC family response regulator